MKKKAVSKYYITLTADKVDVVEINSRIFSSSPYKINILQNSMQRQILLARASKKRRRVNKEWSHS